MAVVQCFNYTHLIKSCHYINLVRFNVYRIALTNSLQPSREKHGLKKNKIKDNFLVPKERVFSDDRITSENKEFIQEVIRDTFQNPVKNTVNETDYIPGVWTPSSRRTGVIARKIGIYPMWTKSGKRITTTLLQVVDNHVIRYHPPEVFEQSKYADQYKEKERYGCLVVGAENADPQLYTAAYNGLFTEAGVMPKKRLTRFRITPDAYLPPGTPLYATHFRVGDYVNVYGITRYHGFQGVMKRWGFKGGPATHGCTKSHRRPGNIGGGRKDHVWKGSKMPGLMGGYRRLEVGLKVWRINTTHNVIFVQGGAVPGVVNNYCYIYDCAMEGKSHTEDNPPPFPTLFSSDEPQPDDYLDSELHDFKDPSIMFVDQAKK